MSPSSRGLGHCPFTAVTGVRIPLGTPIQVTKMVDFDYDQIQYESYPYQESHPEHLYTLARLFGLKPTPYAQARILELGCASGGNIIPVAYNYPYCQIVGLDLSQKQIDSGKALVQSLNLTNIKLLKLSILDIDKTLGKFDYIICHGVYSWVHEPIRDKILTVFRDHLNPQGVAYISYNTYPGWHGVQSIRDMMLFHTKTLTTQKEQAGQARALLQFLVEALEEGETAYSQFLSQEIELLKNRPDSYLLYDHLSEVNFPIYFHNFIDQANQHQLDYLCDANLNKMFPANFPDKTAKILGNMTDIIKMNQYMDFIRNQRFRSTLLCLNTVKIHRDLKAQQIEDFYISYIGEYPKEPITNHAILTEGLPLVFKNRQLTLTLHHPISKMAMVLLQAQKQLPISYSDFVIQLKQTLDELGLSYSTDRLKHHLENELNLMRLVFNGLIDLSSGPGLYTLEAEMPSVTNLVKEQVKTQSFVTNQRHEMVKVNLLERMILGALDGKTTPSMMVDYLCQKIEKGDLNIQDESNNRIINKKEMRSSISQFCAQAYQRFARQALFSCTATFE